MYRTKNAVINYVPPSHETLLHLAGLDFGVPETQRDEMAIPSYLHPNPLVRWLFHRRYARLATLLDVPAGGNVLEFGCGIGAFLPSLAAAGLSVSAIDLVPDYAKELSRTESLGVRFVDGLDDVAAANLDAIVAADVLEHVDDLEGLAVILRTKLVRGGCLVISSPTENVFYRLGRFVAGFSGKGGYHHADSRAVETALAATPGFVLEERVGLPWRLLPHLFSLARFRAV